MAGLGQNPTNTNLTQGSKFLLGFVRLPYMNYFCTKVNIPGLSAGEALQQTPFIDAPVPGDKMVYDPLEITFLIDEPLYAWTSIQDWIEGMTFPEDFDQYKNLSMQQRIRLTSIGAKPQYSDAQLTILSNKNNPILQVNFTDVFPIALSSIHYGTEMTAEQVITGTATFKFTNYDIIRF